MKTSQKVLKVLKASKEKLTTYEIAKRAEISNGAARIHLFKLLLADINLKHSVEDSNVGTGEKDMWWLE